MSRLDDECIMAVVRNRSGQDAGEIDYSIMVDRFDRLSRDDVRGLVPRPKSFIAWVKNNWTSGDLEHEYGRQWEGCAFYPGPLHAFNSRPPDVIDCRKVPSTKLAHPTEKPRHLIEWIIRNNVGDIVLDPFCGSGTTLVAAESLGRKWIGIELEPKYCEIARRRVAAEKAQLKLL